MDRRIPIGIEFYKRMMDGNYYYLDKTLLIKEILDKGASISLFTRPRRFGKTLAMTMLKAFFEDERDAAGQHIDNGSYFNDKKIAACGDAYMNRMGQYPVINLTLKSAKQPSYDMAYQVLANSISREFARHRYVLQGDALLEEEKREFQNFIDKDTNEPDYATSLQFLSECLRQYHGRNVVILIDEYDVPLENAWARGFYDEMVSFIRSLFESALKTNDSLEFAVITGCLRISRESIFTGLNNLRVTSVLSDDCAEYFGFVPAETEGMLAYYGLTDRTEEVQRWYDGYLFGETEVYNPWSVLNFVADNQGRVKCFPKPYWSNTSSNSIVRELVEQADFAVRMELEGLMEGKTIEKPVHEDITYGDIHESQDNLWNFLFFTGYLKKAGERFEEDTIYLKMKIPNIEIRYIYRNSILAWFDKKIKALDLSELLHAIETGDCVTFGSFLSEQLQDSISFFDYGESYYHGFLTGFLKSAGRYIVRSNRESGKGRPDILMYAPSVRGKAFVMELKVAGEYGKMEECCDAAIRQAVEKDYKKELENIGYSDIAIYGICFYRKECLVRIQK